MFICVLDCDRHVKIISHCRRDQVARVDAYRAGCEKIEYHRFISDTLKSLEPEYSVQSGREAIRRRSATVLPDSECSSAAVGCN